MRLTAPANDGETPWRENWGGQKPKGIACWRGAVIVMGF